MKHFLYPLLVSAFILFSSNKLPAQSAADAMTHPVIMKYYTAEQLQYLEQNDTTELKSIIYYFTQSFTVVPIQCDDCVPFDSLNFDIMKFEHLRQKEQTFTRTFDKYGFKLVILPVSQLPYVYAIHQVPEIDPGEGHYPH
jgi:hypothetical protein